MKKTVPAALLSAALLTTLAACGDDSTGDDSDARDASTTGTTIEAAALTMTDPWVKAARSGMTGAFGTLVNDGEEDIVVTGATSDAAGMMELHETVTGDDGSMVMRPKEGGFTVPAGGEHLLEPGGDHLMMMEITEPLRPGDTVIITIALEDGSTTEIDATVKPFSGADEEYQGGAMGDHGEQ